MDSLISDQRKGGHRKDREGDKKKGTDRRRLRKQIIFQWNDFIWSKIVFSAAADPTISFIYSQFYPIQKVLG